MVRYAVMPPPQPPRHSGCRRKGLADTAARAPGARRSPLTTPPLRSCALPRLPGSTTLQRRLPAHWRRNELRRPSIQLALVKVAAIDDIAAG